MAKPGDCTLHHARGASQVVEQCCGDFSFSDSEKKKEESVGRVELCRCKEEKIKNPSVQTIKTEMAQKHD